MPCEEKEATPGEASREVGLPVGETSCSQSSGQMTEMTVSLTETGGQKLSRPWPRDTRWNG